MSFPRMVYHKDYDFKAETHERKAEELRTKQSKLVESEKDLAALGSDWSEHPAFVGSKKSAQAEDVSELSGEESDELDLAPKKGKKK